MATDIQIKRRLTGASGAPTVMLSGELAWNSVDQALYIGDGDDGLGNATTPVTIGGPGVFVDLGTNQSIGGTKTFTVSPIVPTPATGDNTTKVATTAWVNLQDFLKSNQTITVSGDVTGSGSTGITLTLAASGVSAGTYDSVTVDAKGRVTAGTTGVDGGTY